MLLIVGLVALIVYFSGRPIFLYFKDPLGLKKYPTPSLFASITPFWLIHATWSERRARIIHHHIGRLGDVIRVSPNHLIFNDPAAIKDIYGVLALSRGVAKDGFYDRLSGDACDLVQLRNRQEHSDRRKAIANAFAAKTVINMELVIRNSLIQLLGNMDESLDQNKHLAKPAVVNIRLWLNFFTLDVIGDMGFGLPMGFLRNLSDATDAESQEGEKHQVASTINTLHRGVRYSLAMANLPWLHFGKLSKLLISSVGPLARNLGSKCAEDFENICIKQLRRRIGKGKSNRGPGDFMNFILEDKAQSDATKEECPEFTHHQFRSLVADSVMMMNAGSDTTAAALTNTLYFLLSNPHSLQKLREELQLVASKDQTRLLPEDAVFSYESVKDLPFLRACIDESLRLRPPISYQLPRLVSRPVTIAGHDVLPGTVVAVAPYSVHRHPKFFPDPDAYRPERWLEFDKNFPNQREDLKRFNIVFSQGSRACIGRHIAIVELQILISSIIMRYDLRLACPHKELEIFDRFNSNPGPLEVTLGYLA